MERFASRKNLAMRMARRGLALGVLVLGLAVSQSAQAQDEGVTLSARAGFDSYCKDGHWIPVRVTLENSGPDLDGRVEVRLPRDDGSETLFAYPVSLPTVSRKEVFVHVYPESLLGGLEVSFVADGSSIAQAHADLTCVGANNMLYGVLASSPSAFNVLAEARPLNGTATVAQISFDDLPGHSQAWASLDALVISDVDTAAFSALQREALSAWLAAGGRLIVSGGAGWQRTVGGLDALLPLLPDATQTLPHLDSLQTFVASEQPLAGDAVIATGRLVDDAEVLVSQVDAPLVVRRRVGYGQVVFLAADPALEPIRSWGDAGDLYRNLLLAPLDKPGWAGGFEIWRPAQEAATSLPDLELPSASLICGFLGLYVAAVGPLNYIALRVLKRRELAWLSIPGLAIVFAAVAFVLGTQARGNQVIINRLSIVQVWPDAGQAQVDGLVSVFSPYRSTYQMTLDRPLLVHPLPSAVDASGEAWTFVEQDTHLSVPDVRIDVGGIRSLAVEGQIPAPAFAHDLVLDFDGQDATLRGQLINDSAVALRDAVLLGPGSEMPIGDLGPGESRAIQLTLQISQASGAARQLPPANFPGDPAIREILRSFSPFQDKETRRRYSLLQAAMRPRDFNLTSGRGAGFYLTGWSDASPVDIRLDQQTPNVSDTTLYLIALTPALNLETDRVVIPPGLFTWSVIDSVPGASASAYDGRLYKDSYTLRFVAARPIRYSSVESLVLHLASYGNAGRVGPTVSLWDFNLQDWANITGLVWGDNAITDPSRYVGPGGEIRLRLRSTDSNGVQIEVSDFTLVVRA